MTEDQIKHMVNRFLNWKFPEDLNPDGGLSFQKTTGEGEYKYGHQPIGTNLLTAVQAEKMIRYMIDGLPGPASGVLPHAKQFDMTTPDTNGYVPDLSLIGVGFQHRNGHVYTIRNFTWFGDNDEWLILCDRSHCAVPCTRSVKNFFEPGRYQRVA